MSEHLLISSGSDFEKLAGYSRAVVQGPWVFVSGTTGYDYTTMSLPPEFVAQAHACFRNIEAALNQAGASLKDVVRARYIVTDPRHGMGFLAIAGEYFGEIRPAATLIVAGLLVPEMKVEAEVTAFRLV